MTVFLVQTELGVEIDPERLADLCDKWGIVRLEVFGSALRDDFDGDSDIDLLYTAAENARWGLDFVTLCEEFEALFGRPVDMVSRQSIEQSSNPIRRRAILSTARALYEQAG
jgi:predicted nucleotidyltransferase